MATSSFQLWKSHIYDINIKSKYNSHTGGTMTLVFRPHYSLWVWYEIIWWCLGVHTTLKWCDYSFLLLIVKQK